MARLLKTSQSRVARIEAGASDVSLDLMFKGLFALGGTTKDVPAFRTGTSPPKAKAKAKV